MYIYHGEMIMSGYTPEAVKTINEKVNDLLIHHDDLTKNPTVDPSVEIMKIAKACGVKEVKLVPSSELDGKHAVFVDGVVKIDENDAEGQQLFDLAHEVGHIVFRQYTEMLELPLVTTSVKYKAARQGASKKTELSPAERELEDFFDLFAANLLIPIHRFQLWEHESDKKIARAFKVEESCIRKRRSEIEFEARVLSSAMKPCSVEDIVDPGVELDVDKLLDLANN